MVKKVLKASLVVGVIGAAGVAIKKVLDMQSESPAPQPYASPASTPSPAPAADTETFDETELGGEVSEELLSILVDPADKGDLELSDDGKWLINPRNGYRYPIRRGIPVMLIEEGKKHQDTSLIRDGADETEPAETA